MILDRRKFLQLASVTGAGVAVAGNSALSWATTKSAPGSLDFVFFTDTHIEPELDAPHGCDMCFHKIGAIKPEFAIMGGDLVYDAMGVNSKRADIVFELYKKTEQVLQMPIYHTIGNHDAFGVLTKSGIAPTDPGYGKRMYEDRFGKTYYSFDRNGYHFIVLDSIQPTEDRLWEARVDKKQLGWLADDLKSAGLQVPVIVVIHVPLMTAFGSYAERLAANQKYNTLTVANAPEVLAKFTGHNVIAVLQGHTHVTEIVEHKDTKFITSGAVCGNWWHGPRMGVPEGFMVISLQEGKIATRYETYGFHSVDARDRF
jgi:3',5'-cyclic-AMP phosphodiesterase